MLPRSRVDTFSVTHGAGVIQLRVVGPTDLETTQSHAWRALRAGLVAAGLRPQRVLVEITEEGDVYAECHGAYYGLASDPQIAANTDVVAVVADAAMDAFGYRSFDDPDEDQPTA